MPRESEGISLSHSYIAPILPFLPALDVDMPFLSPAAFLPTFVVCHSFIISGKFSQPHPDCRYSSSGKYISSIKAEEILIIHY